jgi:hypothetical protein
MFDGDERVFNVRAHADSFENNLENLKKFEEIILNNPVIKFIEKHGHFKVNNRNKLAWDIIFGSKKASKRTAKTSAKLTKTIATKIPVKLTSAKAIATKSKVKNSAKSSSKPLTDHLKKLSASKTASSQIEQRNIWLKQTGVMYKKVQSWLSEHSKNSHISFKTVTVKLDDNLGNYDIDALEMNMVGEHQIIFKPIETDILGAVGRIDIIHSSNNKTMLLLFSKGKSYNWEMWISPNDKLILNKENVENLLAKWIES